VKKSDFKDREKNGEGMGKLGQKGFQAKGREGLFKLGVMCRGIDRSQKSVDPKKKQFLKKDRGKKSLGGFVHRE